MEKIYVVCFEKAVVDMTEWWALGGEGVKWDWDAQQMSF